MKLLLYLAEGFVVLLFATSAGIVGASWFSLRSEYIRKKKYSWTKHFFVGLTEWDEMLLMDSKSVKWVWVGVLGIVCSVLLQVGIIMIQRMLD